jgi:hypothetical protein
MGQEQGHQDAERRVTHFIQQWQIDFA